MWFFFAFHLFYIFLFFLTSASLVSLLKPCWNRRLYYPSPSASFVLCTFQSVTFSCHALWAARLINRNDGGLGAQPSGTADVMGRSRLDERVTEADVKRWGQGVHTQNQTLFFKHSLQRRWETLFWPKLVRWLDFGGVSECISSVFFTFFLFGVVLCSKNCHFLFNIVLGLTVSGKSLISNHVWSLFLNVDLPTFPRLWDGQFQWVQAQLCGGVWRRQVRTSWHRVSICFRMLFVIGA